MHKIYFYEDKNGSSPVYEYIKKLSINQNKDKRINFTKINDYIQLLSKNGITIGEPYIKHIEDEIWELRPIKNRIFFASWKDESFILLHHFHKKTKKTPKREIEEAKRNLNEILKRSEESWENGKM